MSERYLRRTIAGEEIVVDLEAGEFYSLNETAARILTLWRDGIREPAAIARKLIEEFDVEIEVAEREVSRVLDEAKEQGLLPS